MIFAGLLLVVLLVEVRAAPHAGRPDEDGAAPHGGRFDDLMDGSIDDFGFSQPRPLDIPLLLLLLLLLLPSFFFFNSASMSANVRLGRFVA